MKKRLDALTRVGRFQTLMRDMGRWRLSALERQQSGLGEDLKAVFEALGGDTMAYGAQAGLIERRIRSLELKLDQLEREQDSARRTVLTHGTRAKLVALAVEAASLSYRRLNERKELAEIIERAIGQRSASST
ncbi:MAG TPA: hypothetical protein VGG79_16615 [Roseiarcus sp.]|jgi:hypothetical protein